ncbi:MAG: HAD hydrolase family protein [Elusimicrobiaceae bacterium]|nr:HAD hydrolase family protein [Elusimicrobiaceae bacterium]
MNELSPLFIQKAKKLKLLLTDVDGVMTNSQLSFFTGGDGVTREIKHFESLDGMGLMYLTYCGVETGIVSRGSSDTLAWWAKILGMKYLFYNTPVKHKALVYLQEHFNIKPEETAFIGDDLIDLGMMSRVGLPLAVANSVPEAKKLALYTSPRHGGNAAVRDIAEQILRARGQWDKVVQDNTDGTFTTVKNQIHIVKGL